MGLSDVLLLNYNTDIEAYYIILTEVILKNEQRASVQFHLKQFHTAPTCSSPGCISPNVPAYFFFPKASLPFSVRRISAFCVVFENIS